MPPGKPSASDTTHNSNNSTCARLVTPGEIPSRMLIIQFTSLYRFKLNVPTHFHIMCTHLTAVWIHICMQKCFQPFSVYNIQLHFKNNNNNNKSKNGVRCDLCDGWTSCILSNNASFFYSYFDCTTYDICSLVQIFMLLHIFIARYIRRHNVIRAAKYSRVHHLRRTDVSLHDKWQTFNHIYCVSSRSNKAIEMVISDFKPHTLWSHTQTHRTIYVVATMKSWKHPNYYITLHAAVGDGRASAHNGRKARARERKSIRYLNATHLRHVGKAYVVCDSARRGIVCRRARQVPMCSMPSERLMRTTNK